MRGSGSTFSARQFVVAGAMLCLVGIITEYAGADTQVQVSTYFNIVPGRSNKAEVDLILGEARQKLPDGSYEYSPPPGVADTDRVVVSFFPDTKQVARLDVYFRNPMAPDVLRQQFGTRVLTRDRQGGGQEEVFYPKLHGLVFATKSTGAPAAAVSYFSPRLLADFYVERFHGFMRGGAPDDAQTEADKAVVLDPDYAAGYVAQGVYFQSLKQFDEAIVRYIAGTNAKYSPRARGTAHALLGTLFWQEKKWPDKALPELQKAIAVAPDLDEAHYRYGLFLDAQKQGDSAAAEFARAVELNNNHMAARSRLAAFAFAKGELAGALPHYEAMTRALESQGAQSLKDSAAAQVYYRYGRCLGAKGDREGSIQAYSRSLLLDPAHVETYDSLGLEYARSADFAKAIETYTSGLKIDSKSLLLHKGLVNALLDSGRFEEARRNAEAALRLDPKSAGQMVDIARCWGALGKKKQALYWLEQAVLSGYRDRANLTSDRYLALVQKEGDFKKLLIQMQ